ncbi:imidazolonepropionase, partial [Pseudomonas aeruginosa]|nr:imidazolonepropionase [Pseudomonas aeruginosa]
MKRLWQHCHAATLKGGKYSIVEDAALVTDGPLIHWIGPRAELPPDDYAERIDPD